MLAAVHGDDRSGDPAGGVAYEKGGQRADVRYLDERAFGGGGRGALEEDSGLPNVNPAGLGVKLFSSKLRRPVVKFHLHPNLPHRFHEMRLIGQQQPGGAGGKDERSRRVDER